MASIVRILGWIVLGALFLFLLVRLMRYLDFAWASVIYPFQLEYGEGLVWQQAELMLGPDAYRSIAQYPYTVFEYPPLYHLVVRALMGLGVDPLLAGRSVSVTSLAGICGFAGLITYRALRCQAGSWGAWTGALLTSLILLTFQPVLQYSRLMRVDTLAIALGFLGINLMICSLRRVWIGYLAIIVFVMATYTKQTAIAAPIACLFALALGNWKFAFRIALVGAILGFSTALLLQGLTDGGFSRHILSYNMNTWHLSALFGMLRQESNHGIYFILVCAGLVFAWARIVEPSVLRSLAAFRQAVSQQVSLFILVVVTVMFLLSLVMATTLGKTGADINYFIEGMCIWAIVLGIMTGHGVKYLTSDGTGWKAWVAYIFWGLLLVQAWSLPLFNFVISGRTLTDQARVAELRELTERIRRAELPVLSDDVVLLLRAGRRMPWETAIFTELSAQGVWDESEAVRMVQDRKFAFVVIATGQTDPIREQRFSPAIRNAIASSYPVTTSFAGRTIHSPK